MTVASVKVIQTTEAHVAGFHAAVDAVARERRYLALTAAFPLPQTAAFVRDVLSTGGVHLVAVTDADEVVGWCDIIRHPLEGFRHSGRLGMGLLPAYRGRGIGRDLASAAIAAARSGEMERIELDVFSSNAPAIGLYERLGFAHEGVKRQARKLDGHYDDLVLMALALC